MPALLARTGTFTKPTGAVVVNGLGFRPVALLLWTNGGGAVAAGDLAHSAAVVSPGAAFTRWAWSQHAKGTSNAASGIATGVVAVSGSGTQEAATVALNADGFTLTFPGGVGNGAEWSWQAFGGDATTALAVTGTFPAAGKTASHPTGWTGKAAIFLPAQGGGANLGIGVDAANSGAWAVSTFAKDGAGTSDTQSGTSPAGALLWVTSGLAVLATGRVVNWTGGVTLRADTNTSGNALRYCGLVLGNPDANAVASTGPRSVAMTLGATLPFAPRALLVAGARNAASVPAANVALGIGLAAVDGTPQAQTAFDQNQAGTTRVVRGHVNAAFALPSSTDGTVASTGTAAFTNAGATLAFAPTDAGSDLVGWLLLGSAPDGLPLYGGSGGTSQAQAQFTPRLPVALAASSLAASAVEARLGTTALLGADASGTSVVRADLAGTARLAASVVGTSVAAIYPTLAVPPVTPPGPYDLSGTVNLFPNPSVEQSLVTWSAVGAATLTRTAAAAWDGGSGLAVSGAAGTGVTISSVTGLLADAPGTQSYLGSCYVRGSGTVRAQLTAVLVDGTLAGAATTRTLASTDWQRVVAGVTVPAGRVPVRLDLTLTGSGGAWQADGAQAERDRGQGATGWCVGTQGSPGGVWTGPDHGSPSFRQTIRADVRTRGRGGTVRVEAQLWRATWDNRLVEDLSPWVLDGTATSDIDRDTTWSLDLTMLGEGWARVTPYEDWLAPVLVATYPDGSTARGQLGLYLALESPETHDETRSAVAVRAVDPLWLLAAQRNSQAFVVDAGTDRSKAVRQLLDGAVLAGRDDAATPRYVVPAFGKPFRKTAEWDADTPRLDILNDILAGAGYTNLFTTGTGVMTTRRRTERKLRDQQPVRVWAANVPDGWEVARDDRRGVVSDVTGRVEVTPSWDKIDNEVVLVNDDPGGNAVHVRYRITKDQSPDNPRAAMEDKGRRKARVIRHRQIDDATTAAQLAKALAEELSTRNLGVTLGVLPEPGLDLLWRTVGLALFNAAGEPVAVGQFLVRSVEYGFTPDSSTMALTLGRVDGADGVLLDANGKEMTA